jgi:hypothetical protein
MVPGAGPRERLFPGAGAEKAQWPQERGDPRAESKERQSLTRLASACGVGPRRRSVHLLATRVIPAPPLAGSLRARKRPVLLRQDAVVVEVVGQEVVGDKVADRGVEVGHVAAAGE